MMSSGFLFEDLPQRYEGRQLWFGTIATTAADFSTRVMVIIPEWSPSTQIGPYFWQARDATSLPQRGNRCLVAFDNRRQGWVVSWWPFST